MKLLEKLEQVWKGADYPFLIHGGKDLRFSDIAAQKPVDLGQVKSGEVVALIGDFDPPSILTLLRLIDLDAIVVPLTKETAPEHEYFFETAMVDVVIAGDTVTRRAHEQTHELIDGLRAKKHAGLMAFSTGTTGRPKAILHD